MDKLEIGGVTLENRVILAPMAGVTDLPFRLLCRRQGAGLVCMEMVSAKAVYYRNKNTETLLAVHPQEGPVSLQLFGSDPEVLADTAGRLEEGPYTFLDFNMGCPVPKVVNHRVVLGQPVDAGTRVARLGARREGSHFDESESGGTPPGDGFAAAVDARRQPHRIVEMQPEDFAAERRMADGETARQQPEAARQPPRQAQQPHHGAVRPLDMECKEDRSDDAAIHNGAKVRIFP